MPVGDLEKGPVPPISNSLTKPVPGPPSNQDLYQWYRDNTTLQGHTFNSLNISFTGWYRITTSSSSAWVNLFRFDNEAANCGKGVRILSIFHYQTANCLSLRYQDATCFGDNDLYFPVNIWNRDVCDYECVSEWNFLFISTLLWYIWSGKHMALQ